MKDEAPPRIHGSLVAVQRNDGSLAGALLLGPPGSGKSDVALRMIDQGATLVADDRIELTFGEGGLWGSAPAEIAGLIEARGIGLIRIEHAPRVRILVAVDLTIGGMIERMPARRWYQPPETFRARGSALRIPLYTLDGREAATPAKIAAALIGKVEA